MTKEKYLYRILFLASIFLLLINDFYLKHEYHNYLTGKLSDFAGLFAFPYFISCFFPKRIKTIYILIGILFVFWKSEFSQPFFDFAHSYGIGINRIVDYSDFISLLILPISYIYWNYNFTQNLKPNKIFKPIIIIVSCFAFIATSLPKHFEEISLKSEFTTEVSSDFKNVKSLLRIYERNSAYMNYYRIKIPEKNAFISTSIKVDSIDLKTTRIILDSILSFTVEGNQNLFDSKIDEDDIKYVKKMNQNEIEQLFLEQIKKDFPEK